jgi:hypothetical protein
MWLGGFSSGFLAEGEGVVKEQESASLRYNRRDAGYSAGMPACPWTHSNNS